MFFAGVLLLSRGLFAAPVPSTPESAVLPEDGEPLPRPSPKEKTLSTREEIEELQKTIEGRERTVKGVYKLRCLGRLNTEITRRIAEYQLDIERASKAELEARLQQRRQLAEIATEKRRLRLLALKDATDPRLAWLSEELQSKQYEKKYPGEKMFPSVTQDFAVFAGCSSIPFSPNELSLTAEDEKTVLEWVIGAETDCGTKGCLGLDDVKFILHLANKNAYACRYTNNNRHMLQRVAQRSEAVADLLEKAQKCFESSHFESSH
ncbi:MAG: uncharacterized protein A8A55_0591 [Amphiamblys sp. WSBS2006]|nr:MAG: uncharacterized protein A8A55_0591 [Amphiamblys sp. WSBS2006]